MVTSVKKAIFLDRDGIVNRAVKIKNKPYPPLKIQDVYLVPGIKELVYLWRLNGYLVIIVSNQPDVSNNLISEDKVNLINRYICSQLDITDIFTCIHCDKDACECRKPKIGLFLQAQRKYNIDFAKSFMIGDRWKDIEAGKRVGCKTIFVDYGYDEQRPEKPDYVVGKVEDIKDIKELWTLWRCV